MEEVESVWLPCGARYPEAARQGCPAQKLLVVVSVAKLFWKLGETTEEFLSLAVGSSSLFVHFAFWIPDCLDIGLAKKSCVKHWRFLLPNSAEGTSVTYLSFPFGFLFPEAVVWRRAWHAEIVLPASWSVVRLSRTVWFLQKVVGVSDLEGLEEGLLGTCWELGHSTWILGAALGWAQTPGKGLHPSLGRPRLGHTVCLCSNAEKHLPKRNSGCLGFMLLFLF